MEQETTHELELVFGTDVNTEFTVTITDCVENPDGEAVSTVMDTIIGEQVLTDNAGNLATIAKAAYQIDTTRKTIFN